MLELYLVRPRGFCAGVRRAISIVEEALSKFGAPIYVRHEIVHNKHVITDLEAKGAIFVDDLDEVDPSRPVIFSAHGVSLNVAEQAKKMRLQIIDATCPLVEKVHRQVKKLEAEAKKIIIIGKENHPEIIGTRGQITSPENIFVISDASEIASLPLSPNDNIGFVTQTTLSVYDTATIVDKLKQHFPKLESQKKDDICFATTNRQNAVRKIASDCDMVIIIGSKNSSNSKQLQETALQNGAKKAFLIDDVDELDWNIFPKNAKVGVSAGASAPEYLVQNLLVEFQRRYDKIKIKELVVAEESMNFKT